ncbi:orotidine 5'-phosphate decarboxylase [Candidatus Desantisbacteria bacterium CG2_30_40_21]|uniref:Orotidine 5'-phosphate decarboxylase n=5 Tax=unclassified Candidatus Desantisiibacteriota TaxID=3106372 RepID=A0A2M7JEF7_9BACT|nr:MAG: orotidine 5'-phosphate decarboxylase [Candidatus Desantisbacteria bacterium CG2_30_40_21]PIX17794.1 MAG: orotidine-5'-phosphate decarboxylase [Candidatus Desantisbacteria bacterium CG_4_8_14_3_um_filter_40_12]PIY18994.1 MAG: orotidine-5'-phosphate decarboxylase [Candidatus Desantisbacteria bacterium CG_4_10_14_3_um_filter_40_18]PJB30138.1 MAG: orotidine-5'-phosphate decarboxylase [Candidatus Desantisbacteria bacterium CG_4_9_14_3_um_filter_40_11]
MNKKDIPTHERLILALDVENVEKAKQIVTDLGSTVNFYKLGLQLFMAGGYFELVEWLQERKKNIFVDLKFFDVPQTVKSAVAGLRHRAVQFVSVHGNDAILEAAVENKGSLKILAVTVLTSLDRKDLDDLGFKCDVKELVLSRARRALQIGCDGVISSGLEAPQLRSELGNNFLVVTPGIRPVENKDDQKRIVDVKTAFGNGADYIVVGRPILQDKNPAQKAEIFQKEISSIFSVSGQKTICG